MVSRHTLNTCINFFTSRTSGRRASCWWAEKCNTYLASGLLLLSLTLNAQHAYAAALQMTLASHEVELGQPIWLTLTSSQTRVSLATIDFSAWQDKVALPRTFDVNLDNDNRSQSLRLRVYPLREGQLTLPGLQFLYQTTPPLAIKVNAARDPRSHTPIRFQYQVSTREPWQQQQVIVAGTLDMQDGYAVFRQPFEKPEDVHLLPMQVQQQRITHEGHAYTRYRLGWILFPNRAGKLHVQLPPIEYVRDGVVVRQFYVPPLDLAVQAMPAWLPGTIPVGTVTLARYDVAQAWLTTDALTQVKVGMQLSGIPAEAIPDYTLQLHSNRNLQFYAAQQALHTRIDHHGIRHTLQYSIPIVAKHSGLHRLPDLRLQYFDPESGTLRTAIVQGPVKLILNVWIQGLLLLLLLALLLWLARAAWRWLSRYWRRYQTYQQALQQLPRAASLSAVRQAMQTMAAAEGWPQNFTYRQWQSRMQARTPVAQQLAVAGLNHAGYGRGELDIRPVVQVLARICRQRRFALH